MRLIQPLLAGASLINALDSINYQKVGQCGIPAKGFNDDGDTQLWSDVNRKKRSPQSGLFGGNPTNESTNNNNNNNSTNPLRIVGGTTAKASAWPWQIHLAVCGKWYGSLECNICGGSLIHPRFVVSAAHCVPDEAAGSIILGASNVAKGGTQRVPVDKWIKHPRWGESGGAMFDHDISILRLGQAAQMSSQVSPICLPSDDSCFATGTQCVVTGWGLLSETGGFPEQLQQVSVRLMKLEECRRYSGYGALTKNMVCAGYEKGQQDACAGDSGGPLVCRHPSGAWVLHGVVSWGYGCARANSPGIYARVSELKDFVLETVDREIRENLSNQYPVPSGNALAITSDPSLAMDQVSGDSSQGYDVIDNASDYDKVDQTDKCLKINDDDLFNSGWYDRYKANRENEDLAPAWGTETEEEVLEDTCQLTEEPEINDHMEITEDWLASTGFSTGTIKTEKDGHSPYNRNQECEWRLKATGDSFVRVTVGSRSFINCRGPDALRITPMDSGARTYKMCNVRRSVNINSNHGIRVTFTSDHQTDDKRKTGFRISYRFVSRTHMCDSNNIVMLGDFDQIERTAKGRSGDKAQKQAEEVVQQIRKKQNGYRTVAGRVVFDMKTENFPGFYSTGSQCRWAVKIPDGYKMCYNIRIFRTERSRRCDRNNDVLVSFNSPDCQTSSLETATVNFAMCGYLRRSFFKELFAKEYDLTPEQCEIAQEEYGLDPADGCVSNDQCWVFVSDNDRSRNRGFWLETWSVPSGANCRSYRP